MAKRQVLHDVERDIESGNLGLARTRLHSLIDTCPQDMSLRKKLGEMYRRLHYPERAGCYWFLAEHKTPEMEVACAEFIRSTGGDPHQMLRRIKLRGGPATLPPGFARKTLEDLATRAPNYRFPVPKVPPLPSSLREKSKDVVGTMLGLGCLAILLLILGLAIWGAISLWMINEGCRFVK